MTITLHTIWIPIVITLFSIGGVGCWSRFLRESGGSWDFGFDVCLNFLVAVIVSLAAWLIWALLR